MSPLPRLTPLVFLALFLVPLFPAHGQTMYRCGQTYQDKPCSTGTTGKIVGAGASHSQTTGQTATAVTDPICTQRGEQAKKIVWAREAGRTRDDQLGTASTPNERLLIEEVYLMRGRPDDIAASIATKCVGERERLLQARAIAQELAQGLSGSAPASVAVSQPNTVNDVERQAAAKAQRCKAIDDELRVIQDQERSGGSARMMDELRNKKRNAETYRQQEGC